MAPIERTKSFHLLLSEPELERLQKLAENAEIKQSDYIRGLIKREWEALQARYDAGPGKQLRKKR